MLLLPVAAQRAGYRGAGSDVVKPSEDKDFTRLLGRINDGYEAEHVEDWDEAYGVLEDIIFAAEEAMHYAEKQAEESEKTKPPEEKPTSGWRCSGCKTGTLSRCRDCDEPTCGNCLPVHQCELVLA